MLKFEHFWKYTLEMYPWVPLYRFLNTPLVNYTISWLKWYGTWDLLSGQTSRPRNSTVIHFFLLFTCIRLSCNVTPFWSDAGYNRRSRVMRHRWGFRWLKNNYRIGRFVYFIVSFLLRVTFDFQISHFSYFLYSIVYASCDCSVLQ